MDPNLASEIRSRYQRVMDKIETAAHAAGRSTDSVRLLVVTKTHSLETISAAIEAGICDFGENYADEAVDKIAALKVINGLRWHMIGHVQSRKADIVAQNFDFVHSVDSLKLAKRLDRFAEQAGFRLPILLECNVGGELTKFGFSASNQLQWNLLCEQAEQIAILPYLEIRGLMTMPPFYADAEMTRPFFCQMHALREYLSARVPSAKWDELSMGTSNDFVVAVQEGATIVRVGTAILGQRPVRQ